MNAKFFALLVGAASIATVDSGAAADPRGTWLTATGDAQIRIANCGAETYSGTVIWLKQPLDPDTGRPALDKQNPDASKRSRPIIGIPILISMRANGADRWVGKIYNAEDGNTYEGNISTQSVKTLRVEGCLFGFCQSQNWERAN
ncbi:MAG: DUF2147 domain-containing protein [Pseudorhodoplanes sp.]